MKKFTTIISTPVTYKILIDIFCIVLFTISIFVIIEMILPDIISAYISPILWFVCIFCMLSIISFVARTQSISFAYKKKNNPLLLCGLLIFSTCVALASFRFGIILSLIFATFSTIIIKVFYDLLHEEILHT